MLAVLIGIVYFFFAVLLSPFKGKAGKTVGSDSNVKRVFLALLGLDSVKKREGASFMKNRDMKKVLNEKNNGLLIDGSKLRLSREESFAHNMVVAPTGAGKTTRYVIPNLLALDNCSFVITDPSGELYKQTAGALQAKGYDVKVLAPADPSYSMRYNPLASIRSYTDITELSQTLVRSSGGGEGKDDFWYTGAADIISLLIRCLGVAGKEYLNLGNVLYLLQNFGGDGRGIAKFIEKYADEAALNQFKGFVSGSERTVQSFISTAMTSLSLLNNPDLASLMSENELDFQDLRKRKTALFLILPSNKIKHYRFIMNMMYVDLFNTLTQKSPAQQRKEGKKCLPVYCMMDEFGHTALPDFAVTCTTIRKYEVSLSIILQNFTQMVTNYGETEAKTIIDGGMQSRIFYPGLPADTAKQVEQLLGKEVINEIRWNGTTQSTEQNLLNADRIRTLPDDNAIFLTSNKEAMLLNTLPSYRNKRFQSMMKRSYKGVIKKREVKKFERVKI